MSRVFVSYRRDDSAGHAGRLFDRLEDHFGSDQIFLDVELEPGADYLRVISSRTIPVLVQAATMPRLEQLPPSLRALAGRNALEISDSRFEFDTTRLVEVLERKGVLRADPQGQQRVRPARDRGGRGVRVAGCSGCAVIAQTPPGA